MENKLRYPLLALAFAVTVFVATATASNSIPAIYVFGDSTVDVGNNNFVGGNPSRANFPPYGIDFPGRRATGRFSNGYSGIDYLAMRLGFRLSPPAYLSLNDSKQEAKGVNFASGASGIFDSTNPNNSIPMSTQIRYFDRVSHSLETRIGPKAAKRFLSKSIFYFSTANNDIFQVLIRSGVQNEIEQDIFIGQLTREFTKQLESLYNRGARKFLVSGTGILGCIPIARLSVSGGGCIEYTNTLSRKFNRAMKIALPDMASRLHGLSYSFIDAYNFINSVASNPQKFGFKEGVAACCGSGRLNAETDCTPNSTYCSNRNEYLFWDRYHTTQAFSDLVSRVVFNGRKYASPISIGELVRL
ncbi:GDSL esterase/lipase At5g55050-like [Wolffia australiana]